MRISLSTNWCNQRIESGEEIADKALELGFDELELGFHTTVQQVKGFKACLDRMPIGSVHAFCPVPISAPQGYPELYSLACLDEEARKMAKFQLTRNIGFAAEMGADAVVLHAGRVMCRGFLRRWDMKRRVKRGGRLVDVLKRELDQIVPALEKFRVTLGLENLPYLEGFPAEWEMGEVVGEWVRPWFDTGHDFVRRTNRWDVPSVKGGQASATPFLQPVGLHVNDSNGGDDHLPPGEGKIDFAALRTLAEHARHVVFEPHVGVRPDRLKQGIEHIRRAWGL